MANEEVRGRSRPKEHGKGPPMRSTSWLIKVLMDTS